MGEEKKDNGNSKDMVIFACKEEASLYCYSIRRLLQAALI